MTTNNNALFHTNQLRDCEQIAITKLGITEIELMRYAGLAAFTVLKQRFPSAKKIIIYCGSGNNAGDGYVLAYLAHIAGYSVVIHQYKSPDQLTPSAREMALAALSAGVCCQDIASPIDKDVDLIVDALLGIGLSGLVKEPLLTAINQINSSKLPVLSLDIPSGLQADTGKVMGVCVQAAVTITFIANKLGMMMLDGPDHCGDIICDDLNLGSCCVSSISSPVSILEPLLLSCYLPKRLKNCHKNNFGHVLIVGGGDGMPGSVCLTANAALRVGAGMVTIATTPNHAKCALNGLPEAMIYGIVDPSHLLPLIKRATVCVIGPGLGLNEWAIQLFRTVIMSQLPIIIDASALRILAQMPEKNANWILTPHPGEAANLLNCSTHDIQVDRYHAITSLQENYGGNIVLKGVGSLVSTVESKTYLCRQGNPGMATAGMGDVLSGILGGLVAQGLSLSNATKLGVSLHAHAADLAVEQHGERGLLASDLMPYLRLLVNK